MVKNTTRLSSLMGTWSGQTYLKARVGPYSLKAYFIVHLMPDPMRTYSCQLENCSELDNNMCVERDDHLHVNQTCISMQDEIVEWSDVSAFFYFGARVDAGVPFNVHKEQTTGGWIGPLNMILAQQSTPPEGTTDSYVVRYAETPSTRFLHMPAPNCTLFSAEDFERNLGRSAVRETVKQQVDWNSSDRTSDPYQEYLKTCEHGDVQPILPLLQFDFVQDEKTGKENVDVTLLYKIMTFPHKDAIMYKVFPFLQRRFNARSKTNELHISGPYCYGNDPKRGYTFDFHYHSEPQQDASLLKGGTENDGMTVVHGCVEGLPCLPPPADLLSNYKQDTIRIVHVRAVTFSGLFDVLVILVLVLALSITILCNCRQRERVRRFQQRLRVGTTTASSSAENDLSQPLLDEEENEEQEETEEREPRQPEVTFI